MTWDAKARKVRLVAHRIFQPTSNQPLDFEAAVEGTILDLRTRFAIRGIRVPRDVTPTLAEYLARKGECRGSE